LKRLNYAEDNKKLKAIAIRYLENTEVQGCIEALAKQMMERLAVTADNVNARIAAVAFFDPRSVLEFDHHGVKVKHSRFWTKDEAAAIQSIKVGQHGVELKLHDGLRAAEMLGKQLGTLQDDSEEARALSTKAAAEEVLTTIADIFHKTRIARRGEIIEVEALPAPEE
jgi:phage terminase small subunit